MRSLADIRRMAARPVERAKEAYIDVGGSGRGTGGRLQQMTVVGVNADTLSCTLNGEPVEVAKPPLLREAVIDGQTREAATITYVNPITVTATDGSTVETWKITPSYQGGDIVFAMRGVTGVDEVEWQDLNVDGRAWAKVETS